jgi:hypothetical protein
MLVMAVVLLVVLLGGVLVLLLQMLPVGCIVEVTIELYKHCILLSYYHSIFCYYVILFYHVTILLSFSIIITIKSSEYHSIVLILS